MASSLPVFVFRDPQGAPLVLHPFGPGSALGLEPSTESPEMVFEGRFGALPGSDFLARARTSLDAALTADVRRIVLERGFVFRVVAASVAFLFVYFLFSIAVRDPIPLLDEAALGGLAAFGTWSFLSRRRLATPESVALLSGLRRALGAIVFQESAVVARAEAWMSEARTAVGAGPAAFEAWLAADPPEFSLAAREELAALLTYAEAELGRAGLLGPESATDFEARCRRLATRLGGFRRGGRQAWLAVLWLKGRNAQDRNAEAPSSPDGSR